MPSRTKTARTKWEMHTFVPDFADGEDGYCCAECGAARMDDRFHYPPAPVDKAKDGPFPYRPLGAIHRRGRGSTPGS